MNLARGLREHGMHGLIMIKMGSGGFCNKQLVAKLQGKERGSYAAATTEENGEKYIACVWKGKSEKSFKGKKKRFWYSYFLATDCTTTLPGVPAIKKRHDKFFKQVEPKLVPRPTLVEHYYDGMPSTDIVNRKRQFLVNLEGAVRTNDIKKRIMCTIVGTWVSNAHGQFVKWSTSLVNDDEGNSIHDFVANVIKGGLFQNVVPPETSTKAIRITHKATEMDAFVHPAYTFAELNDNYSRQQKCVMCIKEGYKNSKSSYYCGYCCATAVRETERKPSKHTYCIGSPRHCFSRHVAACFIALQQGAKVIDQQIAKTSRLGIAVAGHTYMTGPPKFRKRKKRNSSPNSKSSTTPTKTKMTPVRKRSSPATPKIDKKRNTKKHKHQNKR
jgi:hypothetical protein